MDTNENTITAVSEQDTYENSAPASDNDNTAEEITSVSAQASRTEKTFTQKELDEIVRNRLERARKDMPSRDDLAAANSAKEAAERDKRALEIRVSCLSKGVSPEYADDVIALAERYAGDEISIESAVDAVIAKYPVFCGNSSAHAASGITTGVKTQTAPSDPRGTTNFIDVIKENQVKR